MSTAAFRHRYLFALLCHVALALVACMDISANRAAKPAEVLARCNREPSFTRTTQLKRWRGFPVDVYIDLRSLPLEHRRGYLTGMKQGLRLWSEATLGRIGDLRVNFDRPQSPISISIVNEPLPDNAIGSTELTFHEDIIVNAKVRLTRSSFEDSEFLRNAVASTTAHEMGHALGIVNHSPFPEDKMWVSGNFGLHNRDIDPLSLITLKDVNTLKEAYCRP